MPETLAYAPLAAWHRRRGWVALLVVPLLALSYVLAAPHFRILWAHQVRRGEIRRQFEAQLQVAARAIEEGKADGAARALLIAEFPTRIEGRLFGRSEGAGFDRRLNDFRPVIERLDALARAGEQKRADEAAARAKREEENANDIVCTIRCFGSTRLDTVRALHQLAAEALSAGRDARALGICEQIMILDPTHRFDAEFWARAMPKP